ncbi:hemerythrin domain-containing protein [Solemya pervernicosa gill symbiont]|nr:hypothetical protein [Solemya pervernicosa gill symbiont]
MVDLVWRKIYELGVEEIDNEHKQLLTLMQEIQAAILRDDLDR